jgi:hypothetical protein
MTFYSGNYFANMAKNFQEYAMEPIPLGDHDPACQTAFGKPGEFVMYLRKSHDYKT